MIIAASFTIWKISIGSKNVFAYVLMYFTVLLGIVYIGLALSDAFRREVELPDRVNYFSDFCARETYFYIEWIAALQG